MRNRWFNRDLAVTMAEDYIKQLRKDAAERLWSTFLGKNTQESAETCKSREDDAGGQGIASEHTQGDNLGCDGCSDIGAVDDGRSLHQGNDTGIDEADGHDRRRTGTLDGGRSERTDSDAQEFAAGGLGEELFEFFRARRLQVGAHHLTRDEEYAESREQCQQRRNDNR